MTPRDPTTAELRAQAAAELVQTYHQIEEWVRSVRELLDRLADAAQRAGVPLDNSDDQGDTL